MKKKLRDITIGEMKAACEKHEDCGECPFASFEYCSYPCPIGHMYLEEEYDLEEPS